MLIHNELRRMSHEETVPNYKVTFEIFLEKPQINVTVTFILTG
jgi:hypothetical protein